MLTSKIINGSLKRKTIYLPDSRWTRPTSSAFKKIIFDVLMHRYYVDFSECVVVDLFAGSGALGLEAVSLGCRECHFVDKNQAAIDVLRRNILGLGVSDRAYVYQCGYDKFLRGFNANGQGRLIMLLDPPYADYHLIYDVVNAVIPRFSGQPILFAIESNVDLDFGNIPCLSINKRAASGRFLTVVEV